MPVSPDVSAAQLGTVQNANMPTPVTLASAATVAPTTFMTVVTGTVQIVTVTPPIDGTHVLCMVPTGALPAFSLAGNVANAGAVSTANIPFLLIYNPVTKKYHVSGKA